ncbi:SRPBCC family protein [Mycobacterium sp. UM_Kg1]|uniref:SRPBCC family protein n=1 Tax=Mycobacterium sp. UM_Kg1 TaxID=1545691 RepID=UPI00061A8CB1|nr:SRPBCC family protein [Mycobacterium sp. UM_Kg1]
MVRFAITRDVDAPAAAVWAVLADFGDTSWIPVDSRIDVEGSGIGMRRSIHGAGAEPVIETLTHLDPAGMELGYSIVNNPLPVSRFEAVVTVRPLGAGGTAITWNVECEPLGPTEADAAAARSAIEAVYGMMAGWLGEAAGARGRT